MICNKFKERILAEVCLYLISLRSKKLNYENNKTRKHENSLFSINKDENYYKII